MASSRDVVEYTSLRGIFPPLLLPSLWMTLVRTLIITVLPLHIFHLGLSYQDVGSLTAMYGAGMTLGNIPAGHFNTRYGVRNGERLEGAMYCVASLLLALPLEQNLWLATAAASMFTMGVAETGGILSRQTFLGATVSATMRGRVGSSMGGCARVGATFGPLVGGFVAHAAGSRAVFLIQAALAFLHVLIVSVVVPNISTAQDISQSGNGSQSKNPVRGPQSQSSLSIFRQHWKVLLTCSVLSCMVLILRKAREMLFSMEGHARGLSQDVVGELASLSYFIDALGFPLGGILMDSVGRTRTGAIGLAAAAISMFLLVREEVPLVVFALVSGLSNASSSGIVLTIGADIAPPDCRAQFLGLYRTVARSSDLIAPLILGFVAERVSLPAAVLSMGSVAAFGIVWSLCCVKETLQQRSPTKKASKPESELSRLGKAEADAEEVEEEEEEQAPGGGKPQKELRSRSKSQLSERRTSEVGLTSAEAERIAQEDIPPTA